jgi:hypothetical protein
MKNENVSMIAKILGKMGGDKTKQTHSSDYYKKLGRYAMSKRWKDHKKK